MASASILSNLEGADWSFVETGDIYNKEVATAFRRNILEKGGKVQ